MKHLDDSELPISTEQISCNLWFMSAPSKRHYFQQIYYASFFLPTSDELHSHCKVYHPASHWQATDVRVQKDLPQLNEGRSCSALAALHAALSFPDFPPTAKWLYSDFARSLAPLPLLNNVSPLVSPPVAASVPRQSLQLGAGSALCTPLFHGCLHGASLPQQLVNGVQRGFCWACHKEKSKSQARNVQFLLLPRGKQGSKNNTQNWALPPGEVIRKAPRLEKEGKDGCW